MSIGKRISTLALVWTLGGVLPSVVMAQTAPLRTDNAALRYWMAFALMQDPASDKATTDLLESVASGKAPWDEGRLGPILDANGEAIQTMQRATKLTDCDWGLEYDRGPDTPIAHLAKARVMARLNTLAGIRLAARGQLPQAVETWLAGVRFAQHVAQGGSLISVLTGRLALNSSLLSLSQATTVAGLDAVQRKRIDTAIRALPETAFDWGGAMRREQVALEIAGQQSPSPPTASDVTVFRRVMASVEQTFRLSPAATRQRLTSLENAQKTLHPFFRTAIPSLSRMNDVRAELQAGRQWLVEVVASR